MITSLEASNLIKQYMPHSRGTLEPVLADRDYPPFNRVMMDGIAVNWNVFKEGKRDFKILGTCAAGVPMQTLSDPSACFEVMTGAPLPLGTDLVIPYEHLTIKDSIANVTLETERAHLENVHLKGSDVKSGEVVLPSGSNLNGPHWGIATSVGKADLFVKEAIRINIISTGDELVPVNHTPLEHQIRRSNVHAIKASLNLFGYYNIELSHLRDEPIEIETHYQMSAKNFDLMIYSGGVSKGKFDYLPETWKKSGVKEIFHGISQRPGKPLWFGKDETNETFVFGLPGNPVSSLVCLHKYFLSDKDIYAVLDEEIIFKKDLTFFVPVKLSYTKEGMLRAKPLNIKNSGEFTALAGSDGFLELPNEQSVFKAGQAFQFHPWRPM